MKKLLLLLTILLSVSSCENERDKPNAKYKITVFTSDSVIVFENHGYFISGDKGNLTVDKDGKFVAVTNCFYYIERLPK